MNSMVNMGLQIGKDLCEAAAAGDLLSLCDLVRRGAPVDAADYDRCAVCVCARMCVFERG